MAKLISIVKGGEDTFLQNFPNDATISDILNNNLVIETLGYDPNLITASVNGSIQEGNFIPGNGTVITINPKPASKA